MVGHRRRLSIAGMEKEAVAEDHALAFGYGKIPGVLWAFFEVVQPKGVGRKQTVIAHMPPRRMPGILRVIEDAHSYRRVLHRPVIVAPLGPFAPGVIILLPGAIDDVAL